MMKNNTKKYAVYALAAVFLGAAVGLGQASYETMTNPQPDFTPWNNYNLDFGRFGRVNEIVDAIESGRKEAQKPAAKMSAPAFFGQG